MLTDEELQNIDSLSGIELCDRVVTGDDLDALIAQAREANALRAQLAEARRQLAAQAPVVEAAERFTDSRGKNDRIYLVVVDYRAFLASRQPPTNVPALISSMIVARVTTTDGETTMVPATLDGAVKR